MRDRTGRRGAEDLVPGSLVPRFAERTDRAPHLFGKPRIAPQPLRRAIAQQIRRAAPGQRNADIGERQALRAKAPLVIVIADAEVEIAHTLLVQRSHRSLNAEQARRTIGPLPTGIAG